MKSIYAIALAGIVSLLAINGSMAQAGAGQTGGNAAGQGAGSQAGGADTLGADHRVTLQHDRRDAAPGRFGCFLRSHKVKQSEAV